MISLASSLGLNPEWGERTAYCYELSPVGSMIGDVLCNTDPMRFKKAADELMARIKDMADEAYHIKDNQGNNSIIRHIVWSDIIECPECGHESTYAKSCITYNPLRISDAARCPRCGKTFTVKTENHCMERMTDEVLSRDILRRKRVPYKIYGITGKTKWSRVCTEEDIDFILKQQAGFSLAGFPLREIKWGMLYRNGYHSGMSHLHHFYTTRNASVLNAIWNETDSFPTDIRNALRIFILSYNASHSTLMTRVVAKKSSSDFILTGAQPGVLYISSLPVEKNIYLGLLRKIKIFHDALSQLYHSPGKSYFINKSSLSIDLPDNSVSYVFTDPPFGDFIPYSEINQINELWLGRITDATDEVVINPSQNKDINKYESLMNGVFKEISRVIKANGWCSVVFHSAKAEIWQAMSRIFVRNRLTPRKTAILDKLQSTFKQTNSMVTVKGDPLILLNKGKRLRQQKNICSESIVSYVRKSIPESGNEKETNSRRYSEYIRICLENGVSVALDADSPKLHGNVI